MTEKSVPEPIKKSSLITILKSSSQKADDKLKTLNLPPLLKNSKVLLAIFIATILLIFTIIASFSGTAANIPTYKVKRDNFLVSITESGEIRAKNSISITSPRVRGNLKIVYLVPEGTYVNAGDTVVRFDPTEALTNLKDAESKLEVAISDKAKLEATQKSVMTRLESDSKSAELSYELSKLNLEQMKFEADVKQQEAKLNHQRNELSFRKAKQELESQKVVSQSEMNKMDIEVQQRRSDLERE